VGVRFWWGGSERMVGVFGEGRGEEIMDVAVLGMDL
jgi:hypothetical protein